MLATMPIFCYTDWPRKLIARMPAAIQRRLGDVRLEQSEHCIYPKGHKEGTDAARVQDVDKVQKKLRVTD